MTEFFSNFGKKISNVGQETVKKTKEIAEIGKISSKIKDEEKTSIFGSICCNDADSCRRMGAIPANHGGSKSKLYENDDRRAETL